MVTRRLLFMGGGITHSSLGGIGMAYYFGFSTTLGALIFAVLSAFGIEYMSSMGRHRSSTRRISEDSATSVVWSGGMAVGVLFIFLSPGYAPNLMSYLFGNLLMTSHEQLLYLLIFNVTVIALFAFYGRAIISCAVDSEFAASNGLPVRVVNIFMLVMLAVGIVLNIRMLGLMLLLSMLTIPVLVARLISQRYYVVCALSAVVAVISALFGIFFSYIYDVPSSAVSIVVLVALLGITALVRRIASR